LPELPGGVKRNNTIINIKINLNILYNNCEYKTGKGMLPGADPV